MNILLNKSWKASAELANGNKCSGFFAYPHIAYDRFEQVKNADKSDHVQILRPLNMRNVHLTATHSMT